jgi:nitrate/nitrite transporter NarK
MKLWQDVYEWSALIAAIHELPLGIILFAVAYTDGIARKINVKWLILFGQFCMMIGTLLCTFADAPDKYWRFVFPGFIIGSAGATLAYTHAK